MQTCTVTLRYRYNAFGADLCFQCCVSSLWGNITSLRIQEDVQYTYVLNAKNKYYVTTLTVHATRVKSDYRTQYMQTKKTTRDNRKITRGKNYENLKYLVDNKKQKRDQLGQDYNCSTVHQCTERHVYSKVEGQLSEETTQQECSNSTQFIDLSFYSVVYIILDNFDEVARVL